MPKISELPAVTVATDDTVAVFSDASGATGKATVGAIVALASGGSVPTGTGFRRVTAGVEDAASSKVDLADTVEVTGTLPVANGGTGLTALGTALQVLRTNAGATAAEWATATATTPGGSTTQLQYNSAGSFGGMAEFTYASSVITIASGGQISVAPHATVGSAPILSSSSSGAWRAIVAGHNTVISAPIISSYGATLSLGDPSGDLWAMQLNGAGLQIWAKNVDGVCYGGGGTQIYRWNGSGIQFGTGATDFGGGASVIGIDNATTLPSTDPTGGGILYADAGALKWRGSSGTVTTVATADPHCPNCARDYILEFANEGFDEELTVCVPCMIDEMEAAGMSVSKFTLKRRL